MKRVLLFLIILSVQFASGQSKYEKAWDYLNQNKWSEASQLLMESLKDPANYGDAYISGLYLDTYMGKESQRQDFNASFYGKVENPYPYIYALWFNQAVVGSTGKKHFPYQLSLVNQMYADPKIPGTLYASVQHQLGMHYLFSHDFKKAKSYLDNVGNIRNWQFTGPFENISQSGFYKDYGPIKKPEPDAIFKSLSNADVKWFTPASEISDAWTPLIYQFSNTTSVVYAQTFLSSENDLSVFCCAGSSGSLKVWVNDQLLIAEPVERTTELDTYITPCRLKKGVNRILVQLGFTDNSYPNFSIRFTDSSFKPVKGLSSKAEYSPYYQSGEIKPESLVTPFAENYFKQKIKVAPENLVNYLLLADVYLRNSKVIEARTILAEAIRFAPANCLLKMKMAEVLIKEDNRTLLLEEIEKIKQLDPGSLIVLEIELKDLLRNQKYDELSRKLSKRIQLYGEDESTADHTLALLIQEKKYDELINEIDKLYDKYPWNRVVLELKYNVKKNVYKDNKGALKLYDIFLKENYNYQAYNNYIKELTEMGENDKALKLRHNLSEYFPYSPNEFYELSKYYYSVKQYNKAEEYILKAIDLSPYFETYWELLGDVQSEKKNLTGALETYQQSLKYDPNQYSIINKIRKLNGKKESYELLEQPDLDAVIRADDITKAKNIHYGYYYILDQKDVIHHPGGATEEYFNTVIRITNEKGVDRYKESSISYGNSQTLLIEKAEVVKKNNARLEGEKNENEIVFTNLEAGDIIVFKYRLRSYVYGRLAKHFWDIYYFAGPIYTATTRYSIYAPDSQPLYYLFSNKDLKPETSNIENFKKYTWVLHNQEPDRDEPIMPALADVSAVLHVSTIPSWNEIANWYSDISNNKAEEDFEVIALFRKLFPEGVKDITQFQKAKIIYDYIQSNIRYSSVSFRQSAFVPQRPSVTLTTRLGDCKDLSSLFVTLTRLAGINAQMVLIDTRNNGQKKIILPSVEFNHCIVKCELDNKIYYLELTDNYLPFASLPNNVIGAAILEIPYKSITANAEIKLLQALNRKKDIVKREMYIKPSGNDLQVSVQTVKYGAASASVRASYLHLDQEKLLLEIEQSLAGLFKNNLKMQTAEVKDLDKLNDSVMLSFSYQVKNEISEIGTIKTFRVTYHDLVATLDKFSDDIRTFPVEYWLYEDIDQYETMVTITAPAGSKFIEIPVSENLSFRDMQYTLQYTLKAPDKLILIRRFSGPRQNIPAADYAKFKAFFEKIVNAERKFIAYK